MPAPRCFLGYPREQQLDWLPEDLMTAFTQWMTGRTGALCDGRMFNDELRRYEPTICAGNPHGVVYFVDDVERFLRGVDDLEDFLREWEPAD